MENEIERLRRKENQAWELAGLARMDRDIEDEKKQTQIAREYVKKISELIKANNEI